MTRALVSRVAVVFALEARARAIERSVAVDRIQPHTRLLPSEAEIDRAAFAARQLRAAADDLRAGLEEPASSSGSDRPEGVAA